MNGAVGIQHLQGGRRRWGGDVVVEDRAGDDTGGADAVGGVGLEGEGNGLIRLNDRITGGINRDGGGGGAGREGDGGGDQAVIAAVGGGAADGIADGEGIGGGAGAGEGVNEVGGTVLKNAGWRDGQGDEGQGGGGQRRAVGIDHELLLEQQARAAAGIEGAAMGDVVPAAVHRPVMQTAGSKLFPEELVLVAGDGFGGENLPARELGGLELGTLEQHRLGDSVAAHRNQISAGVAQQLNGSVGVQHLRDGRRLADGWQRATHHVLAEAAVVGVAGGGAGERGAEAHAVEAEVVGAGVEVGGEAGRCEIGGVEGLDDALVGAIKGRGDVQIGAAGDEVFGDVAAGGADEGPRGVDDVEGHLTGQGLEAEHVDVGVALDDTEAAEAQAGQSCGRREAAAVVIGGVAEAVASGDDGQVVLGVVGAEVLALAPLGEIFVGT